MLRSGTQMSLKSRELKRLEKELADVKSLAKDSSISAETVGDDLTHWEGVIVGPEGTPYDGGRFKLEIKVPADYPYTPPKIRFSTKIWHPNVSSVTGAICLDVLGKEWSPALTIRTALLSILALLSSPEPEDPQDAEVANMYKSNRAVFDQTARYWTKTFAGDADETVTRLVEMGFEVGVVRSVLKKCDGDEHRALNILLGQ